MGNVRSMEMKTNKKILNTVKETNSDNVLYWREEIITGGHITSVSKETSRNNKTTKDKYANIKREQGGRTS